MQSEKSNKKNVTLFDACVRVEPVVDQHDHSTKIVRIERHGCLKALRLGNHHPAIP